LRYHARARRIQDVNLQVPLLTPATQRAVSRIPHRVDLLGVAAPRACFLPRGNHEKAFNMTIQTGTVKWFNESKGYGFIAPDGGGQDLFAHFREIQGEGFKSLTENQRVQFTVTKGAKGDQASQISPIAS
jgi:CspA family cold shock protein